MKRILFIFVLVIALMAGCSGVEIAETSTPSSLDVEEFSTENIQPVVEKPKPSSNLPVDKRTIKVPESVINDAIEQCKDKPMWGVNLAQIEVGYMKGAVIDAVIVLHNGDDAERIVTLSYKPIYEAKESKMTGLVYQPAPIEASGWVTIDQVKLRMDKLETLAVPVHLMVPDDYPGELPQYWEFDVCASGITIKEFQYTIEVTSVENDTELVCHLPQPLLEGDLSAIKSIVSTEPGESPQAVDYNPVTGRLKIVNLLESKVRNLTIIYEYSEMIVIDYVQRWLITMI